MSEFLVMYLLFAIITAVYYQRALSDDPVYKLRAGIYDTVWLSMTWPVTWALAVYLVFAYRKGAK